MQEEGFEIFFSHFISFETVLIHSLRCSGPPSVLGLALNLVTTGIIGMCLSYFTDPSWRRQGNGLIFFTAPFLRAPLLLPWFGFFFFFTMGEGKFLMVASPPIWDTPNQVLSVFGMKEKLAFDF